MYCIRCGSEIEKGSRFCPMCGALQEAAGSVKKPDSARQNASVRKNTGSSGNRKTASERRAAENKKQAAPKPAAKKKSSSASLAIVIISIFAIAAAAAAIFFIWSKTKENREEFVESAVVAQSREEEKQSSDGENKLKELFGLNKEEETQEPEDTETQSVPEEQENIEETVPEETVTPEITQEPEPEPEPEPVTEAEVTVTVKKASQASVSGLKKVSVSYAAATSELKQPDQPEIDNSANSAVDGDVITSWQEDVRGYGEGEYLDFRLKKEYKIRAITFNMGNWRTEELYQDNSRPKDITIWLDHTSYLATIPDGMTQYCVEFSGPVKASEVMIVVDSVYAGRLYDDTCISEITMYAEN